MEGWKPQRGRAWSRRCPPTLPADAGVWAPLARDPAAGGTRRTGARPTPHSRPRLPTPRAGTKAGGGTRRRPDSAGRGALGRGGLADAASLKPRAGEALSTGAGSGSAPSRRVSLSAPLRGGRRSLTCRTRVGAAWPSSMGLPRRAGDPAELRKVGAGDRGPETGNRGPGAWDWGRSL